MGFPRERFGYHVVYDKDIYDAIDFAAAHGFGYIVPDLTVPRFWPENYSHLERRRIRRDAQDHGVSISFHGPSNDLATAYPEVRDGVLKRLKLCLDLARDLEAQRLTIHPSQPPNFSSAGGPGTHLEDHRELYADALKGSIRTAVNYAGCVEICVENDPLTPFVEDVLEELIAEGENLFLTLDVPKARDPSKGAPLGRVEAFYRRHIGIVREAHLHDGLLGGHLHDTLGSGRIDFKKYIRMLDPHDVHFTLEIRPRENAHRSLLWLEGIWNELFPRAGEP